MQCTEKFVISVGNMIILVFVCLKYSKMNQFVFFAFVCLGGYSNWGQFAISIVFNATSVGRVREYKRAAAGEMVFTKDISLLLHFLFKIFSFNKEQERFTIFLPIMFKPQTKNHSKKKSMISEKVAQILIRKRRKKIPSWFYSLSRGMSEDGGDGITFYHTL